MARMQVFAGGLVTALMLTVVLVGLARATSSSGTSSSLVGPPATFSPFKVKRQGINDWEVEVEAKQGLAIATQTITFAPSGQSGWHSHLGPVFISVREGTMTFYEENCTSTAPHAAGRQRMRRLFCWEWWRMDSEEISLRPSSHPVCPSPPEAASAAHGLGGVKSGRSLILSRLFSTQWRSKNVGAVRSYTRVARHGASNAIGSSTVVSIWRWSLSTR